MLEFAFNWGEISQYLSINRKRMKSFVESLFITSGNKSDGVILVRPNQKCVKKYIQPMIEENKSDCRKIYEILIKQ